MSDSALTVFRERYTTPPSSWLGAGVYGWDAMKRATSATVCSNDAPSSRERSRSSADVNRWVAMIDAELRSDNDAIAVTADTVAVTLEFGRTTIDLAAQPLNAGDSLRLDQMAEEPLDLVIDGRVIARGELVAVQGQLGVRIVELLTMLLMCLALGSSPSFADERPRQRPASNRFDDESEILETQFGTVRSSRATREPRASAESAAKLNVEPTTPSSPQLPRRSDSATRDASRAHGNAATGWSATIWPLLLVVGLIVIGARWLKSRSPSATRGLPSEVFEIFGRQVIDPRTSVVLARCGSRLLILSLSPHGLSTLAEITDPVEIDCLAGLCRATARDQTLVETFRSMLHKPAGSKSAPPSASPSVGVPSNDFDKRLAARMMLPRSVVSPAIAEVQS